MLDHRGGALGNDRRALVWLWNENPLRRHNRQDDVTTNIPSRGIIENLGWERGNRQLPLGRRRMPVNTSVPLRHGSINSLLAYSSRKTMPAFQLVSVVGLPVSNPKPNPDVKLALMMMVSPGVGTQR